MGVRVGVANFFLGQSIGIDETKTFKLKFGFHHENCRSHRFGRFVGVKWTWQTFFFWVNR